MVKEFKLIINITLLSILRRKRTYFMKKVELTLPKLRASQQHTDKITAEMLVDCRISNSVRPKKITACNERTLWTLKSLRNAREPFSVKALRMMAVLMHLMIRKVSRCFNKHTVKFLQLCKKKYLSPFSLGFTSLLLC